MIAVINYGMGNIGSILNMLRKVGAEGREITRGDELSDYEKIILPGVGAFDRGVEMLSARGFTAALREAALDRKVPLLGICLGMQLMTRRSEEGEKPGFAWFDADTVRFRFDNASKSLRIPHMGWNTLHVKRPNALLDHSLEHRFYFVHSYHVVCDSESDIVATANYGIEFAAVIQRNNLWGMQFHPEKSHRFGIEVFRKFVSLPCR